MFSRGEPGERELLSLAPLVAEIVKIMRGTFPCEIAITQTAAADLWTGRGDASHLRSGHGETILVVDDEIHIATSTRLLLERHHYRVLLAQHGRAAGAIFNENPDAVEQLLLSIRRLLDEVAPRLWGRRRLA